MKNLFVSILLFCLLLGCKEPVWNPIPKDGITPATIDSYTVKNLSGKSVIHFKTSDPNTLYVVAEYKITNGKSKNAKASKFTDSLLVEGFSKAQEYEVNLFAVGKNEQRSAPVTVKVSPRTPTYITAFASMKAFDTFGGITITADNPERDALVIETMQKQADGTWKSLDRYYTSTNNVKYNIRGLKDSLQNFGIYIRDRWLNFSDTLEVAITPRTEIQIPPANITEVTAAALPGSAPIHNNSSTYNAKKAVDGNMGNYYLTARNSGMPQHFNIDLKTAYNLSRILFYQRETYYYRSISPRKIAIWGSNNPSADGSLAGWTLLGQFEIIKPSGLPVETNSDEDNALAVAGHNLEFEDTSVAYRYIRFQTLETWSESDYVTLREISLFGNLPK